MACSDKTETHIAGAAVAESKTPVGRQISVEEEFFYSVSEVFDSIHKGDIEDRILTKYDSLGNRLEFTSFYADGSIKDKDVFRYDEKNQLISKLIYYPDGTKMSITYKYDDAGNLLEDTRTNRDGVPVYKIVNRYDDMNNQIESISLRWSDNMRQFCYEHRSESKYDLNGNEIESIYYPQFDSERRSTTEYDAHGNAIAEHRYNSDGSLDRRKEYDYNESGKILEERNFDSQGLPKGTIKYKYDAQGKQTWKRTFDSEGALEHEYTYKTEEIDADGNWRRLIRFEDGRAVLIIERNIEYH